MGGGIFRAFQPRNFWWRAVLIGRNLLLSVSSLLVQEDPPSQLNLYFMIMLFYTALVWKCFPWRGDLVNIYDCICSIAFLMLAVFMGSYNEPTSEKDAWDIGLTVVLALLLLMFLSLFSYACIQCLQKGVTAEAWVTGVIPTSFLVED